MVRNGYKIKLTKKTSVNEYIDNLRSELKEKSLEIAKKLVAADVEKLWDAKLIDCAQYDKSILDFAIQRVNEKMQGVVAGLFYDSNYDLRSTINIVEINDDEITVLFNTSNKELKTYFEQIPEVFSYKFYIDNIEEDISEEENNERGLYWQNKYQACNWKTSLLGLSAQITLQPNLEEVSIDASELKDYFRDKDERMTEFINSRIVVEKVSMLLGNIPIDKVSPLALEEMFREAYAYLDTKDGKREFNKYKEKIECGFVSIDIGSIGLE